MANDTASFSMHESFQMPTHSGSEDYVLGCVPLIINRANAVDENTLKPGRYCACPCKWPSSDTRLPGNMHCYEGKWWRAVLDLG